MSLLGSEHWMYSSGPGAFYSTEIAGSLRFDDDDSAYLSKSMSTITGAWTLSLWFKRTGIGKSYDPIGSFRADEYRFENDALKIESAFTSTMLFRDPSAWYHLVISDSGSNQTIYVNGESIGTTGISRDFGDSGTVFGRMAYNSSYFDGYMAEIHLTDGTAYTADAFGELKSGVWVAKRPSVSYGTNGFHLEFNGNTNDSSGNGNNWTANNISSHDYVPDSPTNNFCTMNPLDFYSGGDTSHSYNFRQGNLSLFTNGNGDNTDYGATMGMSSGAWYFEMRVNNWGGGGDTKGFGLSDKPVSARNDFVYNNGSHGKARFFGSNDRTEGGGISSSAFNITYFDDNGSTEGVYNDSPFWENGSIYGLAFDIDNNTIKLYKNGTQYVNIDCNPNNSRSENTVTSGIADHDYPTSDLGAGTGRWFPILRLEGGTANVKSPADEITLNFGQDSSFLGRTTAQGNTDANGYGDFYYTPPSGHLAMCTANMSLADALDPAIDGSPLDHFNALAYAGTGVNPTTHTGVGFQPDLVWLKVRNAADNYNWFDAIRGAGKVIFSNNGDAEATTSHFTAFNTDGFTTTADSGYNGSGRTYVAWNWKANGSGVSNTSGSNNTAVVSANTDAGISIVTYTGNGVTGQTMGHGLTQQPDTIFIKNRSNGYNWNVWHKNLSGLNYILYLNSSSNQQADGNMQSISSTTFGVSNGESCGFSGNNYVAYVFHEVEGFSSFGSYVGNGRADGPFVYTGFRPAYILVKKISAAENWSTADTARSPFNVSQNGLQPSTTNAENTTSGFRVDLLSNGFKPRDPAGQYNDSGASYVYWAFAESPFKYANAR